MSDTTKRKHELTGKVFGKLTVIEPARDLDDKAAWLCRCDCGNTCIIRTDLLTSGKTKSCGCLIRLKSGEGNFRSLYRRYIRQATERQIAFELTEDTFRELTKQSCYYCGVEPQQSSNFRGAYGEYIYNGIDRVDSSLGYTKDNCVPCCKTCNVAKTNMPKEQFLAWIRRIHSKQFGHLATKTPGELIDALITVDVKCFMFQEAMLNPNLSESERLEKATIVLELNKKRNNLMRAIDFVLGYTNESVTPKTYMNKIDSIEKEY